MIEIAVYDTKPYEREYLAQAPGAERIAGRFHEFRLTAETAAAAKGAQAVCVFVNDQADRGCLEILAALGVKLLALRYAGYNNVDVAAARALGLAVVRVPAYSPHAVAEMSIRRPFTRTSGGGWRIGRRLRRDGRTRPFRRGLRRWSW